MVRTCTKIFFSFFSWYVFLSVLAVGSPGSLILEILSGPVFGGFLQGFLISYFCSIIGSSLCYYLSKAVGSGVLEQTMPTKLAWIREKVENNKNNLFWYFLTVRMSPLVPNVFLNLSSPVVGIPFWMFFTCSCIARIPYHVLGVQLGFTLSEVTTVGINAKVSKQRRAL